MYNRKQIIKVTSLILYFQARLQRGNVLLKQGKLPEAKEDYETVVSLYYMYIF